MSSPLSVRLYQAALKIAHSTAPLEWSNVSQPSESTMQTDVSTVTNTLKLACPVTNVVVTTVAKCGAELMTWRDQVTVRKCQTDEEVVTTVETQTVVRVVKTIRRKTMVTRSGEPRFEKLFLGGGCLANEEEPRTGRGLEAERKFFGTCAMQDREAAVMTALRENPGDKEAWNLLGKMLQKREDWLGAIVCFRNALRLDRTHEYALLNLAETYASLGKRRLSVACAFLAYGIAKNPRCVTGAEQLLKREW